MQGEDLNYSKMSYLQITFRPPPKLKKKKTILRFLHHQLLLTTLDEVDLHEEWHTHWSCEYLSIEL